LPIPTENVKNSGLVSQYAPLAQLDRASDYESEGREFESLRAHTKSTNSFMEISQKAKDPEFIDYLMREALLEAQKADDMGEVPVGAVISDGSQIIARAHNLVENHQHATSHAEILAIQKASAICKNWRLNELILCVTLEPCAMCVGAIKLSRIPVVVYGAKEPRSGALGSVCDLRSTFQSKACFEVIAGIQDESCRTIIQNFFSRRRLSAISRQRA